MTESSSQSYNGSVSNLSELQSSARSYIKVAQEKGLASEQSGLAYMAQVLLRGVQSIVPSHARYLQHSTKSLKTRIAADSEVLSVALTALSEQAEQSLMEKKRIRHGDVMAFENALIVTDNVHRTFVKCVENDDKFKTDDVMNAIEKIHATANYARSVANDLSAAYSGETTDTGS